MLPNSFILKTWHALQNTDSSNQLFTYTWVFTIFQCEQSINLLAKEGHLHCPIILHKLFLSFFPSRSRFISIQQKHGEEPKKNPEQLDRGQTRAHHCSHPSLPASSYSVWGFETITATDQTLRFFRDWFVMKPIVRSQHVLGWFHVVQRKRF